MNLVQHYNLSYNDPGLNVAEHACTMQSQNEIRTWEIKWLKQRYRPAPTDDLESVKRVKFEDIRNDLTSVFHENP